MPTTSRGYPYPTLDDGPAGPQQIQALAQAVNDDVSRDYWMRRTRTDPINQVIQAGQSTLVASWPNSGGSGSGNFGSYANGQWTFSKAGLYEWEMPTQWHVYNVLYKYSVRLFINGNLSPDGDNIHEGYVQAATGADPTFTHHGKYPAKVGDVWQMGVTTNYGLAQNWVFPQSWTIVKLG